MNFLRPVSFAPSHVPNGLMLFETEAPDHRCSWKTFCKLNFDLEALLSMFRMLALGLEHMHSKGLIFRDLHPTRVHVNSGVVKWNLLGMPYNFKKLLKDAAFTGHLNYTAPELLERNPEKAMSPKADVFALGCCFFFLATKADPFTDAARS